MTRVQRIYSNTGCYHIMLRGNERKKIFLDNEDRQRFIDALLKKKVETDVSVFAYCLMDNHVHLVLWDQQNEISVIMQGIATSYALFYNNKYERVGHVFQGRFKSEAIENDRYLMTAIRYVHNNPVKAHLVHRPEQYQWNSYKSYINPNSPEAKTNLVDTQWILKMISEDRDQAIREFEKFSKQEDDSDFIDDEAKPIRTHKEGERYLDEYLKKQWPGVNRKDIRENNNLRNDVITELRTNTSLSIVKIADLLDVNRGVVQRVLGVSRGRSF